MASNKFVTHCRVLKEHTPRGVTAVRSFTKTSPRRSQIHHDLVLGFAPLDPFPVAGTGLSDSGIPTVPGAVTLKSLVRQEIVARCGAIRKLHTRQRGGANRLVSGVLLRAEACAGECLLAASQHQPSPMQQVSTPGTQVSSSILALLTYAPPSPMARRAALLESTRPLSTSSSTMVGPAPFCVCGRSWSPQCRSQRGFVEAGEFASPEQRAAGLLHCARSALAVDHCRHLGRQPLLGQPQVRLPPRWRRRVGDDLLGAREGEPLEVAHHVGVGSSRSTGTRRMAASSLGQTRLPPPGRLCRTSTVGRGDEWDGQRVERRPVESAREIHAADDVAPTDPNHRFCSVAPWRRFNSTKSLTAGAGN